jgi:sugar phosphate permease
MTTRPHDHEPFAQTWLGIGLQLLIVIWLIYLAVYLWRQ